ncbi:MAG: hypothetical protein WBZ24_04560, partial [Anaerolineales bacterium]
GSDNSAAGMAVAGYATRTTGTNVGVYGSTNSTSGFAFYAAGSGTDYGPFTGAHEVKLDGVFNQQVKPGLIVSVTGRAEARHTSDGQVSISSTLPTVRLADTPEDRAVLGVLVADETLPRNHWYTPQSGERFASINALGEGRVWVTDLNGDIQAGDYITTSAVPGYGQCQDDDVLHSYTLGKATETVNWDKVTDTIEVDGHTYKIYLLAVVYTSG